jgi:hypothetical protein
MKLLMIYTDEFYYKPTVKTLSEYSDSENPERIEKALTAFIQAETEDEENAEKVETKLVKNLKWGAGKNETKRIVLHSFAHLSESKATPEFTKMIFDKAHSRLENAGYEVFQTPFGYFLDLEIKAPGFSQARMFKSF